METVLSVTVTQGGKTKAVYVMTMVIVDYSRLDLEVRNRLGSLAGSGDVVTYKRLRHHVLREGFEQVY